MNTLRIDAIKVFSEVAKECNCSPVDITPIMMSPVNAEYTFVINGDCSKAGWEASEKFHKARMEWCGEHKDEVEAIIVINFGEGDAPCEIVFDSTAIR